MNLKIYRKKSNFDTEKFIILHSLEIEIVKPLKQ